MNCYCMLCYCQGNSITTNKTPISEFLPLLSRWSNPNSASFIELQQFSTMKNPPLSPSLSKPLSDWVVFILPVKAERIELSDAYLLRDHFSTISPSRVSHALTYSSCLYQNPHHQF